MIGRVSFYQSHQNISRSISNINKEKELVTNQLSTQSKIQELRQDPMGAALGSRFASSLARKETFVKNNREMYDSLNISEGYIQQSIDILQRARDVAVRTANGTFSVEDRSYMGAEINQLIEELGTMVNSQDGRGNYLFGGARNNIPPFRLLRTVSDKFHKDVITEVEYVGSNKSNLVEISDGNLVPNQLVGSDIFWASKTNIEGQREVLNYTVPQDSEIVVNNVTIKLSRGDSIQSIVRKINDSPVDMNASISSFTGRLELTGTDTRQLWISDKTGAVMQDLGIINDTSSPPDNISTDASIFEETLFDTLINLRNAMYSDNYVEIGGKALAGIDKGMDSVFSSLAQVGAISNRLDYTYERMERYEIPSLTEQLDNAISIDIAEMIVKFQELTNAQSASYRVNSQVMQTSLLNYLN